MAARAGSTCDGPGGGPLATLQGGPVPEWLVPPGPCAPPGALSGGAKVFPGGFIVALAGRWGKLKLPLQVQTIARSRLRRRGSGAAGQEENRRRTGPNEPKLPSRSPPEDVGDLPLRDPAAHQRKEADGTSRSSRTASVLGQVLRRASRPVVTSYLRLASGLPPSPWKSGPRRQQDRGRTLSVPGSADARPSTCAIAALATAISLRLAGGAVCTHSALSITSLTPICRPHRAVVAEADGAFVGTLIAIRPVSGDPSGFSGAPHLFTYVIDERLKEALGKRLEVVSSGSEASRSVPENGRADRPRQCGVVGCMAGEPLRFVQPPVRA